MPNKDSRRRPITLSPLNEDEALELLLRTPPPSKGPLRRSRTASATIDPAHEAEGRERRARERARLSREVADILSGRKKPKRKGRQKPGK